MAVFIPALLIGVIAGLRSMTAPAVVSVAARLGFLHLQNTPLSFLAAPVTSYLLTLLALGEYVADVLPKTPSRKLPVGFGARIVTGGFSGAAVGASAHAFPIGLLCGVAGAVLGTLGGAEARARLARAFGRDLPAALLEDAVAIGGSVLIVGMLS